MGRALVAFGVLALLGCSGRSSVSAVRGNGGSGAEGGTGAAPAEPEVLLPDDLELPGSQPKIDVGADGHAVLAFADEQALRAVLYRPRAQGLRWVGPPATLVPSVATLSPSQGGYSQAALAVHAALASDAGESWVLYSRVDGTLFEAEASALYLQRHGGGKKLDREWDAAELVATAPFRDPADPAPIDGHVARTASGRIAVAWSGWGGTISARVREVSGEWTDAEAVPDTDDAGPIAALALDDEGNLAVAYGGPGAVQVSFREGPGAWSRSSFAATGSFGQAAPGTGGFWMATPSGDSLRPALVAPGSVGEGPELPVPESFVGQGALRVVSVVGSGDEALFVFAAGHDLVLDGPQHGGLAFATFAATRGWSVPVVLLPPDAALRGVAVDGSSPSSGLALWYGGPDGIEIYRSFVRGVAPLGGLGGFPGPIAVAPDGSALGVATNVDGLELAVRWIR